MRQQGAVLGVYFTNDGKTLVTRGADRAVRVWDVASPPMAETLFEHTARVSRLEFSGDGQTLLSGSWDREARLWTKKDGKWAVFRTFTHPTLNRVQAAALSPDGARLLTGSGLHDRNTGSAWLWNVNDDKKPLAHLTHPGVVTATVFSSDGKRLLTSFAHGFGMGEGRPTAAYLWDAGDAPKKVRELPHPGMVYTAVFSPDGKTLLTGGSTEGAAGVVHTWDAETGKEILSLEHRSAVNGAAFSPDGELIVTSTLDGTVQLWNARNGEKVGASIHHDAAALAAFSRDGLAVITGSEDRTVRVWDVATGLSLLPPFLADDQVFAAIFTLDRRAFLFGTGKGKVGLVNLPEPLKGSPERIVLLTHLRTGMELVEKTSGVAVMSAAAHEECRRRLSKLDRAAEAANDSR